MTKAIQFGEHPDADQLSAFVEHALPLHEQQQTLAHLATCADCRAIVYLAAPEERAEALHPQPASTRRPWLSGWHLAFPAGLALACLVLITVHLHNVSTAKHDGEADKSAHNEQPAAPAQAAPSPPAPQEPISAPIRTPEKVTAPAASTSGMARSNGSGQEPVRPRSPKGIPKGFVAPPMARPVAGVSSHITLGDQARTVAVMGSHESGDEAAAGSAAAASPQTAPTADIERRALRSSATQYNSGVRTAQSKTDQAYAAVPAPAPPPPPPPGANQTVTVSNAPAALETQSAALAQVTEDASYAALPPAPLKRRLPSLPSEFPAVSSVSNRQVQLAIDSSGSLFRSDDAGVTWQPVAAQWRGRAAKLQVARSQDEHKLARNANPAPTGAVTAAAAAVSLRSFEIITDSGETWTSQDGLTWTHQ